MRQDVRLALRTLRHQPGFAALAILIVALGAGANAAVFSVVRAVLLRPLPYAEPDRLVAIGPALFVSTDDLQFLQERTRSLSDIAASSPGWMMSLLGVGEPLQIVAARPSANLFTMLAVRPLVGRLYTPDDAAAGRSRVMVLGEALWRSRFGGDPNVAGRSVTLEGVPYEIIGVVAAASNVLDPDADAWVPFDPASPFGRGRTALAYARLRDGVGPADATRELQALVPEMRRVLNYVPDPAQPLRAVRLHDALVGDVRPPLLMVAAAVGLLILLTAANLGTLLLGRQVAKRRDAAVRAALGASRGRLMRQTIVDNVVLVALGTAAGIVVAAASLRPLVALLPREIPRLGEAAIDPGVIGVVFTITLGAVLVVGVLPSLLTARVSIQPLLRQGAQTQAPGSRRTLDLLVVGQLALAIVLGAGAALMVRSLWALQSVDPGFQPDAVLTLRLQPAGERYRGADRMLAYYRSVLERVEALPAIRTAGLINHVPLSGYNWGMRLQRDDRPVPAGTQPPMVRWRIVEGEYFAAMNIPLKAGRLLRERDDAQAPPAALVNETLAKRFFGSANDAVGGVIRMTSPAGEQRATIVGVVGDVRHTSIAVPPEPEVYRSIAQSFGMAMTMVVRVAGRPASAAAAVRDAVWSVDPNIAIAGMGPLAGLVRDNLARPRMLATLLFVFAAVGLTIVVCGVYGVVAYSVRRREREMGIRLALGAEPGGVSRLVMRQGVGYAAAGLLAGLPLALAAAGTMRSLLFGIEPRDPAAVGALCALVAGATIAATLVPAWRARRTDPAAVLRAD